jgi:Flp pilus assembly protein TadG
MLMPRFSIAALRARFRRLTGDRRGVSLVEFAIAAPVLLLTLLGTLDVAPALVAKFKVNRGAESAGDIVAASAQMQASDMAAVYAAAGQIMAPLPSGALTMRITNIYSDGNQHAKVYWSCGQGSLPALTPNSIVTTTPTGSPLGWFIWVYNGGATYNGTNTSFVQVESSYTYTPVTKFILTSSLVMTNTSYLMPRISTYVGFPWDGNSADAPTVPTSTTTTGQVTLSNGAICKYAT